MILLSVIWIISLFEGCKKANTIRVLCLKCLRTMSAKMSPYLKCLYPCSDQKNKNTHAFSHRYIAYRHTLAEGKQRLGDLLLFQLTFFRGVVICWPCPQRMSVASKLWHWRQQDCFDLCISAESTDGAHSDCGLSSTAAVLCSPVLIIWICAAMCNLPVKEI